MKQVAKATFTYPQRFMAPRETQATNTILGDTSWCETYYPCIQPQTESKPNLKSTNPNSHSSILGATACQTHPWFST